MGLPGGRSPRRTPTWTALRAVLCQGGRPSGRTTSVGSSSRREDIQPPISRRLPGEAPGGADCPPVVGRSVLRTSLPPPYPPNPPLPLYPIMGGSSGDCDYVVIIITLQSVSSRLTPTI